MRNKKLFQYLGLVMSLIFFIQAPFARALNVSDFSGDTGGLSIGGTSGTYPYTSGTLLNDGGTIYLIRGTQKIPFATAEAFTGLGYSFANVVNGDSSSYAPNGYIINSAAMEHPWGSWVSYKGTVYYVTSQGLVGVPSEEILTSNGGNFGMVLPANQYDIAALTSGGDLSLLTDSDDRVYTLPQVAAVQPLLFFGTSTSTVSTSTSPLVITAPVAGAQFAANTPYSITWTGGTSGGNITIDLVNQGSCDSDISGTSSCASILNIANAIPDAGSFLWLVPSQLASASSGYQLKITDSGQPQAPVVSPVFTVAASANSTNTSATSSLPTVILNSVSGPLGTGLQVIGRMVIVAPSSSSVTLLTVPVSVTTAGGAVGNGISFIDDATSQTVSTMNPPFTIPLATNATTTVTFNNDNNILAGTSKTYDITVPVTGTLGGAGTSSVAVELNGQIGFVINSVPVSAPNPTNQVSVSN
ncbi:MAG: GPI anchored serine-threonine rich family protein [Candidatus Doudnabacteria bacterium]|nr:GPI anchored serine-threonine rich family protein [Candidatus Doudnabacteria bacterium]